MHRGSGVTRFTFCTLPRVMVTLSASVCVLRKQARILWELIHRPDEQLLRRDGGRLIICLNENWNITRSVTLDSSDNDSATYYAFLPAAQLTVASLLASACYGGVSEESGRDSGPRQSTSRWIQVFDTRRCDCRGSASGVYRFLFLEAVMVQEWGVRASFAACATPT